MIYPNLNAFQAQRILSSRAYIPLLTPPHCPRSLPFTCSARPQLRGNLLRLGGPDAKHRPHKAYLKHETKQPPTNSSRKTATNIPAHLLRSFIFKEMGRILRCSGRTGAKVFGRNRPLRKLLEVSRYLLFVGIPLSSFLKLSVSRLLRFSAAVHSFF